MAAVPSFLGFPKELPGYLTKLAGNLQQGVDAKAGKALRAAISDGPT